MTEPTVPEQYRDLLQAPVAVLATNGLSGCPQLTFVAFYHDPEDDLIKISLNDTRQKMKNLRRDPRATLFIPDPNTTSRSLEIRGSVEILPDEDFSFRVTAGMVTARKVGMEVPADAPPVDFHVHDRPGETCSIVVLHPRRILGAAVALDETGMPLLVPPDPGRDYVGVG